MSQLIFYNRELSKKQIDNNRGFKTLAYVWIIILVTLLALYLFFILLTFIFLQVNPSQYPSYDQNILTKISASLGNLTVTLSLFFLDSLTISIFYHLGMKELKNKEEKASSNNPYATNKKSASVTKLLSSHTINEENPDDNEDH